MYPPAIKKLIEIFSRFPTVGPRTATRFAFYLLKTPEKEKKELIEAISRLSEEVKICRFCHKPFSGQGELCEICSDPSRDRTKICVVEKESDLEAIEKTEKYKGLYYILRKTISTLDKEEVKTLNIEDLKEKIKNPRKFGILDASFKEVILALNPTVAGGVTSQYLEKQLENLGIKVTRLGRGLPTGGEIEYADEETLGEALEGRR